MSEFYEIIFIHFFKLQCPFCHKSDTINEAAGDTRFCLTEYASGMYRLKQDHAYYYQVCAIYVYTCIQLNFYDLLYLL